MSDQQPILGIDTGGTFTDFVLWHEGRLRVHKVLSTPDAPERAILQGIRELGLEGCALRVVHGSTVATNAVLEGKGVRTAFIANRGFADLLTIGRQNRAALYDLQPDPVAPPVPPELCFETGGRLAADGQVLEPLFDEEIDRLTGSVREVAPEAVAVNLLFSYLDPSLERRIAARLPAGLFVSLSSEVLPEIREYERGIATWLNAWIGPRVEGYIGRLVRGLPGAGVSVMQSSGDTVEAAQAGGQAVRMLLSGPAGGLVGARFVGEAGGLRRLLTFDMGGTSTDVAMVDGAPRLTSEGRIGRFPVAVPMVDMHTIGAGGGSIAWLDAGGMLQVGPESAGADPGPACYGRGGTRATVTDANLVLGRLLADEFLGGDMALDVTAARNAVARLADAMGQPIETAAQGIVDVANAHMARALRVISVQRGVDPRGFALASFGGAGGLHVCALAEDLDLHEAMVPVQGGVLSALGMLAARPGRQLSRTRLGRLSAQPREEIEADFHALALAGRQALAREGVPDADCRVEHSLDLRYEGQSYTLNVRWTTPHDAATAFHRLHRERYGHDLQLPVELVNLRVAVSGPAPAPALVGPAADEPTDPGRWCRTAGLANPVPLYRRARLARGQHLQGPAIIAEQVATTWLAPGWRAEVDDLGNLRLRRQNAGRADDAGSWAKL
jgi:N-methylhydantoinase A